ncbi:MAG: oligosaccharide flippase family protein [Paracoccaceae bacterium]
MRGSVLSTANFAGGQLLRLISNLILVRLLFPEIFGLMTIVQVFLVGLAMFSDIGLNSAIVQSKRGDDPAFLNTGWTMQVIRGFLLWMMTWALAGPAAEFYGQEMLRQLLPAVGLTAFLQGFLSTKVVTAQRHLLLGRTTVLELGSQAVNIIVTIGLVLIWPSVWSIVAGGIIGMCCKVAMSHCYFPGPANRFQFERTAFDELFNFGKFIFLSSICGFLINNGDRAILGTFVSLTELALYNIAFFFASVPLLLTMRLVSQVMMPLYRERPTEASAENRRAIAKARAMITGTMMTGTLILALIGDWMIRFLYTPEYHGAGPILVFFAIAVLPGVIIASYSSLLMGRGNSRGFFLILLLTAIVQTAALYFGIGHYGIVGAVFAQAIAAFVTYPLILMMLRPYQGWDLRHDIGFGLIALMIVLLTFTLKSNALGEFLALMPAA